MEMAFVAYFLAVISLAVSLYVAYSISELKDKLKLPKEKKQPLSKTKTQRLKGHWD
jgi:hypothetical protein